MSLIFNKMVLDELHGFISLGGGGLKMQLCFPNLDKLRYLQVDNFLPLKCYWGHP